MSRPFSAFALALCAALSTTASSAAHAAQTQGLGHDAIARAWAERHGVGLTPGPAEVVVEALDKAFARIPLGAFDVRVPIGVEYDKYEIADLKTALLVLVETQEAWLTWYSGDPKATLPKETAAERKAFTDFVAALTVKSLSSPTAAGDGLLREVLATDELRAQVAAFDAALQVAVGLSTGSVEEPVRQELQDGAPPELAGDVLAPEANTTPQRIVLAPSRAEFVDFACYVGFVREELQGIFWQQSLSVWNEFDFDGVRVIPLRFCDPGQSDYRVGASMGGRSGKGLENHVMQLGTRALLDAMYGTRLDAMLAAGFSSAMVVDRYGVVETRTDGDLKAGSKNARSVFIPASMGGQSQGGELPAQDASGRWNRELGKGYFAKILKSALKAGSKLVSDRDEKRRTFELVHEDEVQKYPVVAPFFHSDAGKRVVPTGYAPDFADFLRAYRTSFAHFLATAAAEKETPARFAEFLRLLRTDTTLDAFAAIERAYGVPISSATASEQDLEGRFLEDLH